MIKQEYINGQFVVLALIIAIIVILVIIKIIDSTILGNRIEQERINIYNNNNVFPIIFNAIIQAKTEVKIKDFWGYYVEISLQKYGSLTKKLEIIIEEDINKIIDQKFN